MDQNEHIVDFYTWCRQCKHQKVDEKDEPCNECLSYPTQVNSQKPLKFEVK